MKKLLKSLKLKYDRPYIMMDIISTHALRNQLDIDKVYNSFINRLGMVDDVDPTTLAILRTDPLIISIWSKEGDIKYVIDDDTVIAACNCPGVDEQYCLVNTYRPGAEFNKLVKLNYCYKLES